MKPVTRILLGIAALCLILVLSIPADAVTKPTPRERFRPKIRRPVVTAPVESVSCVCPRVGGAWGPASDCTPADRSCDDAATTNVELCDTDPHCAADYSWAKCRSGKKINLSYPVAVIVDNSCDDPATSEVDLCLTDELCGGATCECFNRDERVMANVRVFDCTGWPMATEPTIDAVRPCGTIRYNASGRAFIQLCARPELTGIFDPNCELCKCPGGGLVSCDNYPPNRDCDDSATLGVAELCPIDPQCGSALMCHCPTLGRTHECEGKRFSYTCDNPSTDVVELCPGAGGMPSLDEGNVCCGCQCPGTTMTQNCLDTDTDGDCIINLDSTNDRCTTTP